LNTLLTDTKITRESLRVLVNDLQFTKRISRKYEDYYGQAGAKIGTVLNIRKPPRYLGRVGQGLQIEDATETIVPLVLTTQRGVDIAFTSQDLTLSIDDFSSRFLKPALASVANGIDFDGLNQYLNVYNEIGTPGTVPNTALTYLQVGSRLDDEAAPRDDERYLVLSPTMQATAVNALTGLFNPQMKISDQYEKGLMTTNTLGFDWYLDQNVRTQTVGPLGGVPVINGANQTGNSIITNGWTAAAAKRLSRGDVVTFAGSLAVNPQNKQSTGVLRQFVVTGDVSSDGAGNLTIPISGPGGLGVVTSGPFQTVTASPTNGGAVTVQGAANTSSPRGLGFHKDAFAFASADLLLPNGVDFAKRAASPSLGVSIRLIRAYDINTDRFPCRSDVLYGFATLYPELACRVAS
jgi:hypothetical protein